MYDNYEIDSHFLKNITYEHMDIKDYYSYLHVLFILENKKQPRHHYKPYPFRT